MFCLTGVECHVWLEWLVLSDWSVLIEWCVFSGVCNVRLNILNILPLKPNSHSILTPKVCSSCKSLFDWFLGSWPPIENYFNNSIITMPRDRGCWLEEIWSHFDMLVRQSLRSTVAAGLFWWVIEYSQYCTVPKPSINTPIPLNFDHTGLLSAIACWLLIETFVSLFHDFNLPNPRKCHFYMLVMWPLRST